MNAYATYRETDPAGTIHSIVLEMTPDEANAMLKIADMSYSIPEGLRRMGMLSTAADFIEWSGPTVRALKDAFAGR